MKSRHSHSLPIPSIVKLCCLIGLGTQIVTPAHATVLLQGFYWNVPSPVAGNSSTWWWDNLASQANTFANDGFSAVWIPPATKAWGSGGNSGLSVGYDIFDDYDLGDKNQFGSIPTRYGNRTQLERACAMFRANGLGIYADIVDSHRDGDDGNFNFRYLDAYGNAGGGRFGKSANDFFPNVAMDPNTPDTSTNPDGRWIMPTTGGHTTINGQNWVWADYGMKQSGVWMTNALDLQGYRFDDVRASPWAWLQSFMNYGPMAGKFCVSENWDLNAADLNDWVVNKMANRSTAFDFPLRFNYLVPMCNAPGTFNMASLAGAGLTGVNAAQAVTFVENHDTDNGNTPIITNKIMGYAYILTSPGTPSVFYRDWSTDPGCYGAGMQSSINTLIWIHEKVASGGVTTRSSSSQVYAYERTGGSHLLVGLNADTGAAHTVTCATGFGSGKLLHDYTGHSPDVTTDASGNAVITIPVNNGGAGYVAYSVSGITGSFSPSRLTTTQEYDGAQDLDIKPADNTAYVQAAQVYVGSGNSITGALTFDTTAWTGSTSISLQLLDSNNNVLATQTYTSGTTQGTALTSTASTTGYYTFNIRSFNTPAGNPRPSYALRVTYAAPQTIGGPGGGIVIPPAPTGLSASPGNSQATLTWTGSSGATSYNVYRGTSAGGEGATAITTGLTGTSYTNSSLTNGTTYFYKVAAVNSAGTSGLSNEASATPTVGTTSLDIACGNSAVAPFVADIDFSGGAVSSGTTNAINTSGVTNPAPISVYQHGRKGTFTYTIPGLTAGQAYGVRLDFCEYAHTGAGQRQFNVSINGTQVLTNFDIFAAAGAEFKANAQSFTATANSAGQIVIVFTTVLDNALVAGIEISGSGGGTAPSPVTLSASAGNSQVTLTWTGGTGSPTPTFNVLRGGTSGSETTIATNVSSGYVNTGLTNGVQYFYKVQAVNSVGTAISNEVSAVPTAGTVSAPTNLTASSPSANHVNLTWTAVSGTTSYQVFRGTSAGGEGGTAIGGPSTNSYADSGLTDGSRYYYTVKAVNASGTSGASNEASAVSGAIVSGVDLIITSISWTPTTLSSGTHVVFSCVVKNQGQTATPAGTTIGCQFAVDGVTSPITWSDTDTTSLGPGQSVTLTANNGTNGTNYWTAASGSHTVQAWVDDVNRIAESNENNNKLTATVSVP